MEIIYDFRLFSGTSEEPFDKCGWEYMFRDGALKFIQVFCLLTVLCSVVFDVCLIQALRKRRRKVSCKVKDKKLFFILTHITKFYYFNLLKEKILNFSL